MKFHLPIFIVLYFCAIELKKTKVMTEKKQTKTMRNMYGIEIKISCASCQHKCIGLDGTRLCALMDLIVTAKFKCHKWEVLEGLKKAGRGEGRVKSLKYLEFVRETRMQEQEAIEAGTMTNKERQPNAALREHFEILFGESPYIDSTDKNNNN